MVMTRSSAFHPPPPASLNPDIKSQLVLIVSCLEKLLPFLSAEISKSTVHYNGDHSVNHKDEKSSEKIHGEHNLVHLEEAGDVEPKAMELGAEAVGTDSSEMTKPRSMEVEAKFDQKEIPKMANIPNHQTTPTQPPFTGFSYSLTSLVYPQNQGTTLSQQNCNHQHQHGPPLMSTKPWESGKQNRFDQGQLVHYSEKCGIGHQCKPSTFTLLDPTLSLELNGLVHSNIGAVT